MKPRNWGATASMFQFVVMCCGFVLGRITETGMTPAFLHTYYRRGHERMGKGYTENKVEGTRV